MATFQKRGDSWRAIVRKKGVSVSETFPSKTAAIAWAAQIEGDIISGKNGAIPDKTMLDVFQKYSEEVSTKKAGCRWEQIRLEMFGRDEIAKVHIRDANQSHIAGWRDRRLKVVSAGTVRREWNLLSNACTVAMHEWKWLSAHPMRGVKKPQKPEDRDRLVQPDEWKRMDQSFPDDLNTIIGRVYKAFRFACETAMREGEIARLTKDRIFLDNNFCKVDRGKTSAAKRDVPLSPRAKEMLKDVMEWSTTDKIFELTETQIVSHFAKGRKKALIEDLHFHDSRHVGITKLSKKMDILELARSVGIRDLKTLMVYYNETAEEIAKKLT